MNYRKKNWNYYLLYSLLSKSHLTFGVGLVIGLSFWTLLSVIFYLDFSFDSLIWAFLIWILLIWILPIWASSFGLSSFDSPHLVLLICSPHLGFLIWILLIWIPSIGFSSFGFSHLILSLVLSSFGFSHWILLIWFSSFGFSPTWILLI